MRGGHRNRGRESGSSSLRITRRTRHALRACGLSLK